MLPSLLPAFSAPNSVSAAPSAFVSSAVAAPIAGCGSVVASPVATIAQEMSLSWFMLASFGESGSERRLELQLHPAAIVDAHRTVAAEARVRGQARAQAVVGRVAG